MISIQQIFAKRPLVRELIINNSLSIFSNLYRLSLSALLNILLARELGVETFGAFVSTQALVGIVYSISHLGVHITATRQASQAERNIGPYFGNALSIRLFVIIPLTIVGAVFTNEFIEISSSTLIGLMALFTGLTGLAGLPALALQALNRFDVQTKFDIGARTLSSLVVIAVLITTGDLVLVLMTMCLSQLGIYKLFDYGLGQLGHKIRPRNDLNLWRTMIVDSFPLILAGSAEFINLRVDSVFIASMIGEQAVGIYGAAYNIYLIAASCGYFIAVATFPTLSRYYFERNSVAFLGLVTKLSLVVGSLGILVSLVVLSLSNVAISLVYGSEFLEALLPLQILIWALPFYVLNRFSIQALIASNQQKWTFRATFLGAIFNLSTNFVFVPQYGILAAAATTVVTEALVWLVTIFGLRKAHANRHYHNEVG
ncbi:MAG TPA: flippase [Anaerolineae bacterium]|nr:flippase [Anaerolineae bacterium]HMR65282.1 flippase [Anaerolineae bacterium]